MILWTDASVKSHYGAGIGWHIQSWGNTQDELLRTVDKGYDYLSDSYTSEEAELLAMTRGVKEALSHGERTYLRIRCDCQPLVTKVENGTRISEDGEYMTALLDLLDEVDEWEVKWVERDENSVADRQAHVGLDRHV